jgi:hypothetical protein
MRYGDSLLNSGLYQFDQLEVRYTVTLTETGNLVSNLNLKSP